MGKVVIDVSMRRHALRGPGNATIASADPAAISFAAARCSKAHPIDDAIPTAQ